MLNPFVTFKENGSIWRAGHTVWGLCSAWNHATRPGFALNERQHQRASKYARAIQKRMARLGLREGVHYKELSNGAFWPLPTRQGR